MDLESGIGALKLESEQAEILALRLRFGPQDWNLGFQAGIWSFNPRSGSHGWDLGFKAAVEP